MSSGQNSCNYSHKSLIKRLSSPFTVNKNGFSLWFPVVRAESLSNDEKSPEIPETSVAVEVTATEEPAKKEIPKYEPPQGETGWERVKGMYSTSIYGEIGPEWAAIKHGTVMGFFTGAFVGALVGAKNARVKYLEKNEATLYTSEMAGRRALQDKMTVGMGTTGFKWGWRVAAFTGMYLGIVTHLSVYFNETYLANFSIAGAISGGLFKFLQGPSAALVASGLGAGLGLLAGGATKLSFYLAGTSLEEMRHYHYHVFTKKNSELMGTRKIDRSMNKQKLFVQTVKEEEKSD